ncbi:MAG TPA: hypothetical protein VMU82_10470 [Acetobacteraceae bacterium]|nr:hypothetical protein [Acetobacteraceae bacterium]
MQIRSVIIAAAALLAAAPLISLAQAGAPAGVTLRQKAPFGSYLADANGRALYMFTADKGSASSCYGPCASAWPPFVAAGQPTAGQGLQASMVGTSPRKGGVRQITYSGKPLYYFAGDSGAGTTAGEDIEHFGGYWYLVSPAGAKIEKEGTQKSAGSSW